MNESSSTMPVWNLDVLYKGLDDPALSNAIERIETSARTFEETWRGRIAGANASQLLAALKDYEKAMSASIAPHVYAHLRFAANSGDAEVVALLGRIRRVSVDAHRRAIFFNLELDAIDDGRYASHVQNPELAPYAHYLRETRRQKPHRLSEPEEAVITLKSLTGKSAFVQMYSQLTSSFRFASPLEEGKVITGPELLSMLKNDNREVRRKVIETYSKAYEDNRIVISSAWNALALDHRQDIDLRGYGHPMDPVNQQNELSAKAVETLMEVTRANYGLARRYYKWKAKTLGYERLLSSDLIAPLPGSDKEEVSFETAKRWVLEAFAEFHESFARIAADFFTEGRIDGPPRPGKSGGAFCMGASPDLPVYVLLNHTGKVRDAATMAHELGHGIHFTLAKGQPLLEYGPVLPLAETASVFGELLLTKKLMEQDLDPVSRRNLLAERIEDILATTFRQAMYTDFELAAHLKIAHEPLSPENFCDLWAENLQNLYGDAVETLPASRWTWSAIPHFVHTRFYCYAYTFGELLVFAFYRRYQEEGAAAFAPKLIKVLEAGGSKSPGDLVAELGYDLEDPEFWAGGYRVLEGLIEELEGM